MPRRTAARAIDWSGPCADASRTPGFADWKLGAGYVDALGAVQAVD